MQYYPIFLDLKGKKVLVIGGGNIALEKILNLLKAGAVITVVAPEISAKVRRFNRRITYIQRYFEDSDIQTDYSLIFAATGDTQLNAYVSQVCLGQRILCNTVDDPKWCHFIVPSILRRGYLTVAISTAGVSPTLAKTVKHIIGQAIGPRYTQLTRWLASFRWDVRAKIPTLAGRMAFWTRFYQNRPMLLLRKSGLSALKKEAHRWLEEFHG